MKKIRNKIKKIQKDLDKNIDKNKEIINTIQKTYLHSINPNSSFRSFSLDASDLTVLENIENNNKISKKETEEIRIELEKQDNEYNALRKTLKEISNLIETAKSKNDIDILNQAKALLDKISSTREEIITTKDKLDKQINALYRMEL